MIPAALRRLIVERAGACCEYCGMHQDNSVLSFHVEHVIPQQHRGQTTLANLALACPNCNLRKGPNLTGTDPRTGEVSRLFHPQQDRWTEHFEKEGTQVIGRTVIGSTVIGRTVIGRTSVRLLAMNTEDQMRARSGV